MIGDPFEAIRKQHRPKVPGLDVISAAELQRKHFPPIAWTVPGILPEGLTLLCGRPKAGKSWLALDFALAVATGGETLGREVAGGEVLYLSLEDNERRLRRRCDIIASRIDWPEGLEFATQGPRLGGHLEAAIRAWAENCAAPRLVVIDTLGKVRPTARAADTAHSADYAALGELQTMAGDLALAVVLVHHVRKLDADDPFDTVSGSTGLTGAADSTLILAKNAEGVTLYGRGRDLEEIEIALEFDEASCRWLDLGDPAEAFSSDTRRGILDAIRVGESTPQKMAGATGLEPDNIRQTLGRMLRAGTVKREGRGVYSIPADPLSHPSQCHNGRDQSDKVTVVTPPLQGVPDDRRDHDSRKLPG